MSKKVIIVLLILFFGLYSRVNAQSPLQAANGNLMIRSSNPSPQNPLSLYFLFGPLAGIQNTNTGSIIRTQVQSVSPLKTNLEFYTNLGNEPKKRMTLFADGSFAIGAISPKDAPVSAFPVSQNQPTGNHDEWLYDYYLDMNSDNNNSPTLHARTIRLFEFVDPPDMIFTRADVPQANRAEYDARVKRGEKTTYGPLGPVAANSDLGGFSFRGWGTNGMSGDVARIYARNEKVAVPGDAPGALYFATTPVGATTPVDRMTIRSNGFVGINTNNPTARLHVNGDVRIENGRCTGCADVAEDYQSKESLESGDIVSIDEQNNSFVRKSNGVNDSNVFGVVSTSPAVRIGEDGTMDLSQGNADKSRNGYPVALAGRVPVKVTTENGVINPGDYLTASSIPGVAMKATRAGSVIGKAMGTFNANGVGTVTVFVAPTWYTP